MSQRTPWRVVPALALALAGAACSSSTPSAPSLPDTTPTSIQSATVQGTVNAGSATTQAERSLASAAGVRVSVVGTALTTSTDAAGRFVLTGLPTGSLTLRFEGPGLDARLQLSGLMPGQVLTIEVQARGSSAALVNSRSEEVEFEGAVEALTPPSLRVAGRQVLTDSATEIKRGNARIALGDLKPGEHVKVEGTLAADGSVQAREIKASGSSSGGSGATLSLRGRIEALKPPELVVAGRSVSADSQTKYKGEGRTHSLDDFRVGDEVEVEGVESTARGGVVLAREIKRLERADDGDDDDGDDDGQQVEIKGRIDSIAPPNLVVAGRSVRTDASTRIEKDHHSVPLSALRPGERVEVKGRAQSDGSVLASRIEVDD